MLWIFGGAWVRRGQAVSNQKKRHLVKTKLIPIFLPLVLFGCSKKEPTVSSRSVATSAANKTESSRPQITFVESAETKEQHQIKSQALTLLTNKDYTRLEE